MASEDVLDLFTICRHSINIAILYFLQSTEALDHHKFATKMGIIEVVSSNSSTSRSLSNGVNVAIVLEEEVVLENMGDFVSAFIVLFGLLYALNMEHNKDLKCTFEFIQKVFLKMGTECSKRVQILSKLLEKRRTPVNFNIELIFLYIWSAVNTENNDKNRCCLHRVILFLKFAPC